MGWVDALNFWDALIIEWLDISTSYQCEGEFSLLIRCFYYNRTRFSVPETSAENLIPAKRR
jgi:hypothetical protein